jgi:hypothetical protein
VSAPETQTFRDLRQRHRARTRLVREQARQLRGFEDRERRMRAQIEGLPEPGLKAVATWSVAAVTCRWPRRCPSSRRCSTAMSEPMTPDEIREHEKTMLRAHKAIEAIQSEITATHFACWALELRYPELYPALDDDGPPEDGPPEGWTATELN